MFHLITEVPSSETQKQHYKLISGVPDDFLELLWNVKAKSKK